MTQTLPAVDPAKVAALVAAARRDFAGKRTIEDMLTPEEIAGGVYFYFELRGCVHELRSARERIGMTAAELAEQVNVTEDVIVDLEDGMTNPTWKLLGDYAHAVGLTLSISAEPKA